MFFRWYPAKKSGIFFFTDETYFVTEQTKFNILFILHDIIIPKKGGIT